MAMRTINQLVRRWIDERVIEQRDAETDSYVALGDFFDWLRNQEGAEGVEAPQWGSAMKQLGFPQVKLAEEEGDGWVIKGIKLEE